MYSDKIFLFFEEFDAEKPGVFPAYQQKIGNFLRKNSGHTVHFESVKWKCELSHEKMYSKIVRISINFSELGVSTVKPKHVWLLLAEFRIF